MQGRLRTNGPNFNYRKEGYACVLYAIENGGFSGQIMPQNIVVGPTRRPCARFLAKYAGREAPHTPTIGPTRQHLLGLSGDASSSRGSRPQADPRGRRRGPRRARAPR